MSRVRFHAIDAIGRTDGIELVKDGPGFGSFSTAPNSIDRHNPDYVIWYNPFSMNGYKEAYKSGKQLIGLRNETYNNNSITQELKNTHTDIECFHLVNDMAWFQKALPSVKFFNVPHCAEKAIFYPSGEEKQYDILLCGNISSRIYPLRSWFSVNAKKVFKGYKVKVMEHPGYRISDPNEQVRHYAREINKAKCVIHCSSVYKYALAKFAEIAACGVCQFSDIPNDRPEHFRKFVVEIGMDHVKRAVGMIRSVLDSGGWKARGEIGYEASKEMTQEKYAERFLKGLKEANDGIQA